MTTYRKLCVITALLSALMTAWLIQSRSETMQLPENQYYPTEDTVIAQPQYYVFAQPRMMTLVWRPNPFNSTNLYGTPEQNSNIGI